MIGMKAILLFSFYSSCDGVLSIIEAPKMDVFGSAVHENSDLRLPLFSRVVKVNASNAAGVIYPALAVFSILMMRYLSQVRDAIIEGVLIYVVKLAEFLKAVVHSPNYPMRKKRNAINSSIFVIVGDATERFLSRCFGIERFAASIVRVCLGGSSLPRQNTVFGVTHQNLVEVSNGR